MRALAVFLLLCSPSFAGSLVIGGHVSSITEDERFLGVFSDVTGIEVGTPVVVAAKFAEAGAYGKAFITNHREGFIGENRMKLEDAEDGFVESRWKRSTAIVWATDDATNRQALDKDAPTDIVGIETMFIGNQYHGSISMSAMDIRGLALNSGSSTIGDFHAEVLTDQQVAEFDKRGRGPELTKWWQCDCHGGLGEVFIGSQVFQERHQNVHTGEFFLGPKELRGESLGTFEILVDRVYYRQWDDTFRAVPEPSGMCFLVWGLLWILINAKFAANKQLTQLQIFLLGRNMAGRR